MNKINLSAVILAKEEEKNIKKCIEALGFCDEIIVIDDHSQDDTAVIADRAWEPKFI
jgi:glycosyltransferase involved in cell wall biosynthesis